MGNIGSPKEAVLSSFFQKSFLNVLSLAIKSKIFPLIREKEDEERSPLPHNLEGAVKVKVAQSRLTLCDPMDYTGHGILQARILECVAFPFSIGSFQSSDCTQVSCIAGRFFTS